MYLLTFKITFKGQNPIALKNHRKLCKRIRVKKVTKSRLENTFKIVHS